ncbi:hypothetical protein DNP52_24720, partial [Salmonella enterica subsp. enterica serovar Panama]
GEGDWTCGGWCAGGVVGWGWGEGRGGQEGGRGGGTGKRGGGRSRCGERRERGWCGTLAWYPTATAAWWCG